MTAAYIENCLRSSLADGPFDLGGDTIPIERPVRFTVTANQTSPWGLKNGRLARKFTEASPGLIIEARGGETQQLRLLHLAVPGWRLDARGGRLYQAMLFDVRSSGSLGHGGHMIGPVFETAIVFPQVEGAAKDGLRFENAAGFDSLSAINVTYPNVRFAQRGIVMTNDGAIGAVRDVVVRDGYVGHCRSHGALLQNGTGLAWAGMRFESNCRDVAGAQLWAVNDVNLHGCSFGAVLGKATCSIELRTPLNPSDIQAVESKGSTPGFVDGLGLRAKQANGVPWVTFTAIKQNWSGT